MPITTLIDTAVDYAVSKASNLLSGLLTIQPQRSFASFSDFVSISEGHTSEIQTTDYPIEDGTQGTDHIVRQPDVLSWELAFRAESNPKVTLEKLKELQRSGVPFDATTGLVTYHNLLLLSIATTTDSHTARILRCQLTMKEIVITKAQLTVLPDKSRQANPKMTAGTQQSGKKQVVQAGNKQEEQHKSWLASVFG